jgi:hypothetical protein
MAEVLVKFVDRVQGPDGTGYQAQACGAPGADGLWQGWIEFRSGTRDLRTGRETSQPNRDDLLYWAQGLTHTYLEGALARALAPGAIPIVVEPATPSVFTGPADEHVVVAAAPLGNPPRAILDPYAVYAEGEDILISQLNALSLDQLANVAEAYLVSNTAVQFARTEGERSRLISEIVATVKRRTRAA